MADPAPSSPSASRPRALDTILIGGLIAGILDGLDAILFYRWAFAVPPDTLFQSIASGLFGRHSFQMGWTSVLIGVLCHFTIAIGAAAVFYAASLRLTFLFERPFVFGPAFGICVYLVMHYVVRPLSAVPPRTVPVTHIELANLLFAHLFFVGLPVALMARKSARTSNGA